MALYTGVEKNKRDDGCGEANVFKGGNWKSLTRSREIAFRIIQAEKTPVLDQYHSVSSGQVIQRRCVLVVGWGG